MNGDVYVEAGRDVVTDKSNESALLPGGLVIDQVEG
jgi:hypothetical protein